MKKLTSVLFLLMVFMVGGLTAQISEDQKLKQEEFQRMQQQQLQEQTDQKIQANSQRLIRDLAPADARDFSNHPRSSEGISIESTTTSTDISLITGRAPDVVYETSLGASGFYITPNGAGGDAYIGNAITLGGTNRNINTIFLGIGNNNGATADYDMTVRIYTDCPTDAVSGCGSGPGVLVGEQTVTVTPSPGNYIVQVDFPGSVDVSSDADGLIYVMMTNTDGEQGWFVGENVITGTGDGFIPVCGPNLNGCAFDVSGTTGTNNFAMAIIADSGPVISCPMDIVVNNDAGECGAIVNFSDATAVDPDDGVVAVSQTGGLPSGSLFPEGVSVVEFSATDSDGNTSVCQFTITVNDTEDPTATCQDITVTLDAMGMATINAADLLASSDDNCGVASVVAGSPAGMAGSLSTLFAANNGGAPGGTVYFDLTVGPQNLIVTGFETNTPEAGAVSFDIYTIVGGTYAGNESNAGAWSGPIGTASGTGAGVDNPTSLTLGSSINLMANTTYAMALVMDPGHSHAYTNGNGSNENYSNADMSLELGSGSNTPFGTPTFNPRVWNGTVVYATSGGSIPVGSTVDFDCSLVGSNQLEVTVTDASGNSTTCTANVTVVDDTPPMVACIGQPVEMTANAGSSPGGAIPDNDPTGFSDTITVTDDVTITDFNVLVDVSHTWVGDLQITLQSPAGTVVTLMDRPGVPDTTFGCSEDDIDATFDDEGADPVETTCPLTSSLIPEEALSAFDGESTAGDWTLTIIDNAGGDTGTLNEWGVSVTYDQPGTPLEIVLDANGMASFPASDLLVMADDACGWTASIGGGSGDPCSQDNPSNALENGGVTNPSSGFIVANDLMVAMGTDFQLNQLTLNLFHDIGATIASVDLVYYEDNAGEPGAQIGSQAGVVPTSQVVIGNNFGFDVSETVFDVAPFTFAGDMSMDMSYWISASVSSSSGGLTAWEITSASSQGADALVSSDGGASWAPVVAGLDGVYVFSGNCIPAESDMVMLDCSNLGENLIDVTVTDSNGNTATCTATVNVSDETSPVLVCADVTIGIGPDGVTDIEPEDLLANAPDTFEAMVIGSDNQSFAAGTTDFVVDVTEAAMLEFDWDYTTEDVPGFDSFGYVLNGTYTVLTDPGLGNQSGSASVSVAPGDVFGFRSATDDNVFGRNQTMVTNFMPGFDGQFAPANWSLELNNSDGDAFFITIPGGPLSFDACGITVLAVDVTEVTCDDVGSVITATVFASDASGNIAACTSQITVVDDLAPEITCPEDQTVDPGAGNLFYEVPDYWDLGEATATDNCTDPVVDVTQSPAPGELLADGTYTVVLTATDDEGNTATCEFELTVESILGVNGSNFDTGISIFPNPAVNQITISNATNIGIDRVMIYDMNGRLVSNTVMDNMEQGQRFIDVSALASGPYIVQIEGNGQRTIKRLIKE